MPNPYDHPTALKDLQDAIYRDRVQRARGLSPEERFDGGIEHTNFVMQLMHGGAMEQKGLTDIRAGWGEVRRRMERLCHARDHQFYSSMPQP
jgi:hypothetical protein